MEKNINNNNSMKKDILTLVTLFFASAFLSYVSIGLRMRSLVFIKDNYISFIVSTLVIYVLLIAMCFAIKHYSGKKTDIYRDITIVVVSVCVSLVASVILDVFVNNMALVLILAVMLVAITVNIKVSVYTNIMISVMYLTFIIVESSITDKPIESSSVIAVLMSMLTAMMMVSLLNKNYTRYKMIAGSVVYAVIATVFVLPISYLYSTDIKEILFNCLWFITGQMIAIALYAVLLPLYETVFNVWTDFKLAEVASFSHPLLKRLREEAPGTFNHSLVVGNLAESCAIAIGEDPYLARVAAYYHDVGKLKNPKMFVENQDDNYNPHDELIPEVSARMITRHAKAGYDILKEYKMPDEIAKIALEHHGTSPVMFFYMKAQKITEGKLSMNKYRYDGPKPSTKIAAIIMICDTVEAAVRSRRPETEEELRAFVKKMIKDKMDLEQFDNCNITFEDLNVIQEEIVKTIPSIFHHRIDYNKEKK